MANATLSKDEILDAIGNMSVLELADLIEAFKDKFNVTIAAAPVGGAAPAAARPPRSRRSSPSRSRTPARRRSR
jgi:ribosomal protein L7/L12